MAVIRKQAYDLTAEDFEIYPVWEYALDEEGVEGQDESTMRPFEHSGPLDTSKQQLFVKAHFTLADGTRFRGWLPARWFGESDFGTLQPVIFADGEQIHFWNGVFPPTSEELKKSYELLGRNPERVFPIQFSSSVELIGGPVTGMIPAFLYPVFQQPANPSALNYEDC